MLDKILRFLTGHTKGTDKVSKTVLVIDDGEVERKYISASLEKGGYKVVTAEEGETGLKIAKEIKPQLILLDFIMPGLRGDAVCQRLKMSDETRNIPVIFLTGSVKPQNIIDSYESGAEYYLSKPIGTKELLKQVGLILRDKDTSVTA
jgi:CheY-like chemotaxis protein